jgi:hypothetical protein
VKEPDWQALSGRCPAPVRQILALPNEITP